MAMILQLVCLLVSGLIGPTPQCGTALVWGSACYANGGGSLVANLGADGQWVLSLPAASPQALADLPSEI